MLITDDVHISAEFVFHSDLLPWVLDIENVQQADKHIYVFIIYLCVCCVFFLHIVMTQCNDISLIGYFQL